MTTNHDPGRGLTKAQLRAQLAACRRELAERRRVGGMLANIAFNLVERHSIGYTAVLDEDARCIDVTRREWDAIAREGGEGGG
jgi:hypothetical protein